MKRNIRYVGVTNKVTNRNIHTIVLWYFLRVSKSSAWVEVIFETCKFSSNILETARVWNDIVVVVNVSKSWHISQFYLFYIYISDPFRNCNWTFLSCGSLRGKTELNSEQNEYRKYGNWGCFVLKVGCLIGQEELPKTSCKKGLRRWWWWVLRYASSVYISINRKPC